jgi:hypothetical protein
LRPRDEHDRERRRWIPRDRSRKISREAYVPLVLCMLWMVGNVVFTELVSPNPPDSSVLRLYLAVFGYKRWLLTWPIVALTILGLDALVRRLFARMRSNSGNP